MSEYWVSQAKFYCKFCSVWIADNKPTRQLHDGGAKHRLAVDEFHKKKRNEKLFGARSEGEIKQQLAEIERAAQEAIEGDRQLETGFFYVPPSGPGAPPPPPPPRPPGDRDRGEKGDRGGGAGGGGGNYSERKRRDNGEEEEAEIIPEDESGTYTVDGQTYLEGSRHEALLTRGMNCEVFIEEADEWYAAVILGRKDMAVPHTDIVLRTYNISYVRVVEEGKVEEEEVEEEEGMEDKQGGDKEEEGLEKKESEDGGEEEEKELSKVREEELDEIDKEGVDVTATSSSNINSSSEDVDMEDNIATAASAAVTAIVSPPVLKFTTTATGAAVNHQSTGATAAASQESVPDIMVKKGRALRWDPKPLVEPLFATNNIGDTNTDMIGNNGGVDAVEVSGTDDAEMDTSVDIGISNKEKDQENEENKEAEEAEIDVEPEQQQEEEKEREPLPEPELQTVAISGVRSDVLRLLCDEDGNVLDAYGTVVYGSVAAVAPVIEVATGYSAWQTVSVRMVDEEEEAILREEEEMRAKEEARVLREKGPNKYQAVQFSGKNHQEEDVMSTFDPYGTSKYKGMSVHDDEGKSGEEVMSKVGEKVGFKKRKKMGGVIVAGGDTGSSCSSSSNNNNNSSNSSNGSNSNSNNSSNNASHDTVRIKIEKVEPPHYPLESQAQVHLANTHIKTENKRTGYMRIVNSETVKTETVKTEIIKTEMKIEPKLEPPPPPPKMVFSSFSFNGAKKIQKK